MTLEDPIHDDENAEPSSVDDVVALRRRLDAAKKVLEAKVHDEKVALEAAQAAYDAVYVSCPEYEEMRSLTKRYATVKSRLLDAWPSKGATIAAKDGTQLLRRRSFGIRVTNAPVLIVDLFDRDLVDLAIESWEPFTKCLNVQGIKALVESGNLMGVEAKWSQTLVMTFSS